MVLNRKRNIICGIKKETEKKNEDENNKRCYEISSNLKWYKKLITWKKSGNNTIPAISREKSNTYLIGLKPPANEPLICIARDNYRRQIHRQCGRTQNLPRKGIIDNQTKEDMFICV